MSRFLTDLAVRLVDEFDEIWQLTQPLAYESDRLGAIVVPQDFKTDFASVPRLPLAYLVVGGKGKRAAVVHDWLYSGGQKVDRKTADQVFAEALAASGYGGLVRGLMYAGVRLGGGSHFDAPNVPQPPHVEIQMEAP